jgi:hypothetical protein
MDKSTFTLGQRFIVKDAASFYHGQEATVVAPTDWLCVWNARIGNVFFCINERYMGAF